MRGRARAVAARSARLIARDARRRAVVSRASGDGREALVPRAREGATALAKLSMASHWRIGQRGYFDADAREAELDFATPLGFEPLIGDGRALRRATLEAFPKLKRLSWNDGGEATTRAGVFATSDEEWVVVVFRGTTPSPLRGLIRESQINGRAGQVKMKEGRAHAGYARAYEALRDEIETTVRDELERGGGKKVVVTGHSLGGALTTLCAASLAEAHADVEVEAVTFGQPRVGDKAFARYLDQGLTNLNYARIVHGGDLFARVPTSGYWLPSANDGKFAVEYAHAGSMLWTNSNSGGGHTYVAKGEEEPEEFSRDVRMLNPITVANHHSGYARFFEDSTIADAWPKAGLL